MTLAELLPLLRCVECAAPVSSAADHIVCTQCGAHWSAVNGVCDLRPRTSLPLPRMYDDPHYQEWNRRLAKAQDYFYRANPIISWVQNAGHRVIRSMSAAA